MLVQPKEDRLKAALSCSDTERKPVWTEWIMCQLPQNKEGRYTVQEPLLS